jgi:hypothetical protein
MQEQQFSSDNQIGFILDKVRPETIEGKFVERVLYSEKIIDPLGGEQSIDRVEFKVTEFISMQHSFGLELINAPRSTTTFTNKLLEICDDSLSLQAISINPIEWGSNIGSQLGEPCTFTSVQLSKLALERSVSAQAVVTGGVDVRSFLGEITNGRTYTVDKAKIEIGERKKISLILSSQATASSTQEIPAHILEATRDVLTQINARDIK